MSAWTPPAWLPTGDTDLSDYYEAVDGEAGAQYPDDHLWFWAVGLVLKRLFPNVDFVEPSAVPLLSDGDGNLFDPYDGDGERSPVGNAAHDLLSRPPEQIRDAMSPDDVVAFVGRLTEGRNDGDLGMSPEFWDEHIAFWSGVGPVPALGKYVKISR
jgi:hypothetical protein